MTQEQINAIYAKGFRDGIQSTVYEDEGKLVVGFPPVPLDDAQKHAESHNNYAPPKAY